MCAATPDRDTQADGTSAVLSDVRVRFDGQAYGAAPTRGLGTLTETLKSRVGKTATYLDNAASFDTYGRGLTTTGLASTSVFDPTNDAVAPVTTPSANPTVTTTAYTPATGRPTKTIVTTPPATVGVASSAQSTTTYTDLLRGLPIISVDSNALRTDLSYDALGRNAKVWLPDRYKAGGDTPNYEFAYSIADGAITSIKTKTVNNDGSQDTSYSLFDGFNRLRQTQAPGDNGGRILTDTFYDERGRAALSYAPYYATANASGTLFKVEDATGVDSQVATQYDGLGRAVKTTLLAGNGVGTPLSTTTSVYGGDRVTVTPPKGATPTTTITDASGKTTELRQYKAATASGAYDATTYRYDAAGHLAQLSDPSNASWTWTYDQLGRKVKAVDPDAGTTSSAYNDRGELVTTTDGRGKVITRTYDNLSRQLSTHDGSSTGPLLTSQTWDPANNKGQADTTIRYVTVGTVTYQYKVSVNTYDKLYRPTKSTVVVPAVPGQEALQGSYVSGSDYNADGTVRSTSYPAAGNLSTEAVAFTYDKLHRPATIGSNLSGYLTGQNYSLTNKPLQSTLNAGGKSTWVTNAYEAGTQRLASSRTDQEGGTGAARAAAYTYDEAGNITELSDVSRYGTDRQCFRYDYLARLTESFTPASAACPTATDTLEGTALGGPAPYWTSYTYNLDGTHKTETQHDPAGSPAKDTVRAYTYPATSAAHPHSLTSTAATTGGTGTPVTESYAYDAAGNTLERHLKPNANLANDQTLTWDSEGHLNKVLDSVKTKTGSTTVTTTKTTDYVYGPDGTRLTAHTVDTASPAAENTTLYLGGTELNLVKGAAKPKATRYYPVGAATAVRTDDNKVAFQVTDNHGTAELNIDAATGSLTQRRSTPFGAERGTAPTTWAGTKGFVGGTKDTDTGLTHLGAREYDPAVGRFISIDPLFEADKPQSLNGYGYAENNPVTQSDPLGLSSGVGAGCTDDHSASCSGSFDEGPGSGTEPDPDEGDSSGGGSLLGRAWNGVKGAAKDTGSGVKHLVTDHASHIVDCVGGNWNGCESVASTYWQYSALNPDFYVGAYHGFADPAAEIYGDFQNGRAPEAAGKISFFLFVMEITDGA